MTEIFVSKLPNGTLMPDSEQAAEYLKKFKVGQPIKISVKRVRNYEFHKKWFALLTYAYDVWEPEFEKNFDRFRKDITILAGFYESTYRLNGETRIEAKSVSFDHMSQDDFDILYDKTLDVVIKYVCKNYSGDELRAVVDQVMTFA